MSAYPTDNDIFMSDQPQVPAPIPTLTPNDEFWVGIGNTLIGGNINEAKKNIIITLLKSSCAQGIVTTEPQITELADLIKLKSISEDNGLANLNALLEKMASTLDPDSVVHISHLKQKIIFWREVSKYLVGVAAGVAIINAIVPIEFALIAQGLLAVGIKAVAAVGSAVGTSLSGPVAVAPALAATDAAAAAAAGPSMGSIVMASMQTVATAAAAMAMSALQSIAITCGSAIVSAGRAMCDKATMPNAEMIAEFAAQAAMFKAALNAGGNSYEFLKKLNNGDYDDVIEQMIIKGEPLNQITNELINVLLEQGDVMRSAQFGIVLPGSAPVRIFDRDLDPEIDTYIAEHFAARLETQTKPGRVKSDIMQELSTNLDNKNAPNYDENVVAMIQKYGPLVILYELYSVHNTLLKRSVTYPPRDRKLVLGKMAKAKTLPKGHRYRPGSNEYYIAYELKRQILNNYPQIPSIPFVYIPDFQGIMSDCMKQVLGRLYDESMPSQGNIFTAISRMNLTEAQQKYIFDYVMSRCVRPILPHVEDEIKYEEHIQATAAEVRAMMAPQPSVGSAVKAVAGPFKKIGETPDFTVKKPGTRRSKQPQEASVLSFKRPMDEPIDPNRGGRKSRRYKKRKSTLKRRRIRRRRLTKKGRKRRYTKRR